MYKPKKTTVSLAEKAHEQLKELASSLGVPQQYLLEESVQLCLDNAAAWRIHLRLTGLAEREASAPSSDEAEIVPESMLVEAIDTCGLRMTQMFYLAGMTALLKARLKQGFFVPEAPPLDHVLQTVREGVSGPGTAYLRHHFLSYWLAADGPAGWSALDPRWAAVCLGAAGIYRKRNPVTVTWSKLRRELRFRLHVVSFFRPEVAASIYREHLGNTVRPRVWDPSCGFGARMLGFFSVYPEGIYCGNEPADKTRHDLVWLAQQLGDVDLRAGGSETRDVPKGPFDLVFTSPPYFDTEKYFDEPNQSWVLYPEYSQWVQGFLRPTLVRAVQETKKGGTIIFNVDQRIAETIKPLAAAEGLIEQEGTHLSVRSHPFRSRDNVDEPILVWRKP